LKQVRRKHPTAKIVPIFQPTGNAKAAITGDFLVLADQVTLIKALRGNGIEVTAIHNHMLDDQPRAFFSHFRRMLSPPTFQPAGQAPL
jgi:Domain of Unknown Function (DUF1259)